MTQLAIVLAVVAGLACGSQPNVRPSPSIRATPSGGPPVDTCRVGAQVFCVLNPDVTQATIRQTICRSGWTRTIRPPVTYTDALKRQQLQEFASEHPNDPNWMLSGTEEDHRMPLELGGAPRDPKNLSPEEPPSPNAKDRAEDALRQAVCSGQMTLEQAQGVLRTQWLRPYPAYGGQT